MQQPPFLLDTGQIPCMGFELRQDPSSLETVNEFTKRMESATKEAKSAIHKAQEDMTRYYNQRRSLAPVFQPGDQVYLDASDIKTTRLSLKLSHRRLGPFENRAPSKAVSLLTQVVLWIETIAPGVQRGQVVHCSGRSDTRKEAASPAATYCHRWRTRMGGRGGIG